MDVADTGAKSKTLDNDGDDPVLSAARNGHSGVIQVITGRKTALCTTQLIIILI